MEETYNGFMRSGGGINDITSKRSDVGKGTRMGEERKMPDMGEATGDPFESTGPTSQEGSENCRETLVVPEIRQIKNPRAEQV